MSTMFDPGMRTGDSRSNTVLGNGFHGRATSVSATQHLVTIEFESVK